MLRPADVHRGRALRVGLGAVHVRPGGGVQHELRRRLDRRRRQGHVPVVPRERRQLVARERLPERAAELAAGPRQEDASRSRSERIGDARAPEVADALVVPRDAVLVRIGRVVLAR